MIAALSLILMCQLVGEALAHALTLPVPGPVIGLGLLFAGLCLRGGAPQPLRDTANGMLRHLSLLFVPAGTGIMLHLQRVADEWPMLLAALLVSTLATMAVTALVLRALHRTPPVDAP